MNVQQCALGIILQTNVDISVVLFLLMAMILLFIVCFLIVLCDNPSLFLYASEEPLHFEWKTVSKWIALSWIICFLLLLLLLVREWTELKSLYDPRMIMLWLYFNSIHFEIEMHSDLFRVKFSEHFCMFLKCTMNTKKNTPNCSVCVCIEIAFETARTGRWCDNLIFRFVICFSLKIYSCYVRVGSLKPLLGLLENKINIVGFGVLFCTWGGLCVWVGCIWMWTAAKCKVNGLVGWLVVCMLSKWRHTFYLNVVPATSKCLFILAREREN